MALRATSALPLELEREIFTATARIFDDTIPTLLRVAHRVLAWIEPMLYRTLMFPLNRGGLTRLHAAVKTIQTKPLPFMRANVRHVMCWDFFGTEDLTTLLSVCTGVQNLALCHLSRGVIPHLRGLHLQRLTLPIHLFRFLRTRMAATTNNFFSDLTHLHLTGFGLVEKEFHIGALPRLTHLCIDHPAQQDNQLLCDILTDCTALQALVCTFKYTIQHPNDPWIDHPRVVLVQLDVSSESYNHDWKLGTMGGRDFWRRADEFLARKRNNKTIATQVCDGPCDAEIVWNS
ncbi:hypothetical protein C8F04DRAFT_1232003 [Mycena alexandri]|uniref:F-box domain-containing protein n=1 Tax=Mycena alexandri TaxID=1745969 RepID=A0AAD6X7L0_9AGAR|nr:hypothetical protein C8F04DRAFT_1237323 [Mycena alexandri]KAJ7038405.1 hypothetical protein C8F04DRAFT_1232003 [Mycena alexandri]